MGIPLSEDFELMSFEDHQNDVLRKKLKRAVLFLSVIAVAVMVVVVLVTFNIYLWNLLNLIVAAAVASHYARRIHKDTNTNNYLIVLIAVSSFVTILSLAFFIAIFTKGRALDFIKFCSYLLVLQFPAAYVVSVLRWVYFQKKGEFPKFKNIFIEREEGRYF